MNKINRIVDMSHGYSNFHECLTVVNMFNHMIARMCRYGYYTKDSWAPKVVRPHFQYNVKLVKSIICETLGINSHFSMVMWETYHFNLLGCMLNTQGVLYGLACSYY